MTADTDDERREQVAAHLDMNRREWEECIGKGCDQPKAWCKPAPNKHNPACRAWLGGKCPQGGVMPENLKPPRNPSGRSTSPTPEVLQHWRWVVDFDEPNPRAFEFRPGEPVDYFDRRWINATPIESYKRFDLLNVGESTRYLVSSHGKTRPATVTRVL